MTAGVVDRTTTGGQPGWRRDRRPVVVAIAVVAVVVAACWLLRWWGPFNPWVTAAMAPAGPTAEHNTITVTNNSWAPVEVVSVAPLARGWFESAPPSWAAPGLVGDLPVVPGGASVEIPVAVPPCGPNMINGDTLSIGGNTTQWWAVEVRSTSGRTAPLEVRVDGAPGCRPFVPTPGVAPADPAAAEAAVVAAFATVYEGAPRPEDLALIDDPRGVVEAVAAARAGEYGPVVDALQVRVLEVVFDRPDHAWVRYQFPGTVVSERWGEAVAVDGTWKVARATVCTDLTLVSPGCG